MRHDRHTDVAVQEQPDLPWWEDQARVLAPPEPVRHERPRRPRSQPGSHRSQPETGRGQPETGRGQPEDQAQSEAAPAAPPSYITTDDRKLNYAELGVPQTLDPLSSSRFLGQLVRRFVLYSVVTAAVDAAVLALSLLLTVLGRGVAVTTVAPFVGVLSVVVLLGAFWLLPAPALLGQWSRLLSFQAPAAGTALDCVAAALDRHATPSDTLGIRPLSPAGEGRRDYLELQRGYFAGYVSCFPLGHDLYVGWSFWIHISPLRVLLMWIGRKVQDYTGRGNDMYQTLRFESARATVAAIHTCTLEGVDAATDPPGRSPLTRR